MDASIHASCVDVGGMGVLIRGPSGCGKSRLALALILAGRSGTIAPTRLVADDRVLLRTEATGLLAAPPEAIAGLIEIRGVGLRRLPFAPHTRVGLVVDLAADDAARLPLPESLTVAIAGVTVPRLPLAPGIDAAFPVIGLLISQAGPPET